MSALVIGHSTEDQIDTGGLVINRLGGIYNVSRAANATPVELCRNKFSINAPLDGRTKLRVSGDLDTVTLKGVSITKHYEWIHLCYIDKMQLEKSDLISIKNRCNFLTADISDKWEDSRQMSRYIDFLFYSCDEDGGRYNCRYASVGHSPFNFICSYGGRELKINSPHEQESGFHVVGAGDYFAANFCSILLKEKNIHPITEQRISAMCSLSSRLTLESLRKYNG